MDINTQKLAQALSIAMKDASTTPTFTSAHGPGGVMSQPADARVINAAVMPVLGLQSRLPYVGTTEINPLVAIMTGVTEGTGSNPTEVCETWPRGGNVKSIEITWGFGRQGFSTPTVNLTDPRLGGIINRGEFRDFTIVGGAPVTGTVAPSVPGNARNILQSELGKMMYEYEVGWLRKYGRFVYTGNPANNVKSGSDLVYGEFAGLDILVNTGYQDAVTKTLSPAADSLVRNINLNIAGNGDAIVREFTYAYRRQMKRASDAGLSPVDFVFVMPHMLFTELADVWPCAYATNRCVTNANGATVNLDASEQRRITDEMRAGEYLLIDGRQIPVIIDDAITESESSGEFTSSVYLLPLRVAGSMPVLYVEHFDFNNAYSTEMRNAVANSEDFTTSDGGRFFWTKRKSGPCVSMEAVEMSRLILKAPFLAVRFTNVKYTPLMQNVSGWPTDTSRFYNGGLTSRTAPSFYSPNVYAGY